MANELIRPIDADFAHAIEEASKAASKAIEAAMQSGRYVGAVLGDLPHDLVGIIGDWVAHKRARRWAELQADTEKILSDRGIANRENVSPSVVIPLIAAAVNEDREILKQMWAKMLAAALDPNRTARVRPSIIVTLKQMDPIDALIMEEMDKNASGNWSPNGRDFLTEALKTSQDEILVSFDNLTRLGCIAWAASGPHINPLNAPLGRLLMNAVRN